MKVTPHAGQARTTVERDRFSAELNAVSAARSARVRLTRVQRAAFIRNLALTLQAGVPVAVALDLVEGAAGTPREAKLAGILKDEVTSGAALSAAFARQPGLAGLTAALASAGEASGRLADAMTRLADVLDAREAFRARVVGALAYPAVVLAAAVGVIAFMVVGVVPSFAGSLDALGTALPPSTQAVLAASTWLQENAGAIGAGTLVMLAVVVGLARLPFLRSPRDRLRLMVPGVAGLTRDASLASVCHVLALLTKSGAPLADALEVARVAAGNAWLERAWERVASDVTSGVSLTEAMQQRLGQVAPIALGLIRVGEGTGALDVRLAQAADRLETSVAARLKRLATVLEPAVIMVLGAVVGGIVFSLFMPMMAMMGAI